jgi:hypothetical protein
MHMFATNYNVLRVQSGMAGLAFSNWWAYSCLNMVKIL